MELVRTLLAALCLVEYVLTVRERGCEVPTLRNGNVRTRNRNRVVRFNCGLGFTLWGSKYATCSGGSWDVPTPACTRPGCPAIANLEHGISYFVLPNRVVMFLCYPGYRINGTNNAYCNGRSWNGTQPTCVVDRDVKPELTCDFESETMCGWVHDPNHDFNWRRQNLKTPSGHMQTGPSYDHTLGDGNIGYYMYIESTSRLENDSARLLSPLYVASLSKNACFRFFYHMYGRTTGSLRVYLHPQSVDFSNIRTNATLQSTYTMFQKSGDQGDQWYKGFFNIAEQEENFQIVMEGVRGPGYISDIAIDDVALLQDEKCVEERKTIETTPSPNTDSCVGRCNSPSVPGYCSCEAICILEGENCCVDYKDFCTVEDPLQTSSTDDDADTMPPPLPTSQMMTAENGTLYEQPEVATTTTTSKPQVKSTSTTSKPKVTQMKTTTTATKPTIPTLKYVTASLPLMNATGILNRLNITKMPTRVTASLTTKPANTTVVPINESDIATFKPSTTIQEDEGVVQFSKAYHHYGRNETGHMMKKIKNASLIVQKAESPRWYIYVLPGVLTMIVALVIAVRYRMKTDFASNALTALRRTWSARTLRTSSHDNGDMRFLVHDEELEHEID